MTLMLSRRGARSALVACGALAALLTAMSFAWPAALPSGPGKPDADPLLLLPQSTIGFLSFDGGPCTANAKKLALAELWNEPEVQAFLKPVIGIAQGGTQVIENFLPGLESGDLLGLMRGRVIVALTGLTMPDEEHSDPRPQLIAAIRFGGAPERMGKLVAALERKILSSMGDNKPKPVTVGGEPAKRMDVGEGMAVIWLVHDGWLLVGTSEEQLGAGIARLKSGEAAGSILADDLWKAAAVDLVRPQTVVSFWVGIAKLMPMFQAQMPKQILDQVKMYKSAGWAMDIDGKVVHDRIVMDGVKGHPMYASLMNTKADVPRVLSIMPKSTMLAGAGALDITATYDYFMSTLAAAGAGGDFGKQFAKKTGVKLKEDLLANLGPEYGYYVAPTPHGLIPDLGIVMRTKDPVKMTAMLKRIVASVSPSMLLDPVEYNGSTIEVVDLLAVSDDHGGTNRQVFPRICWTFVGDYLVITPWPQAAKRVIDGAKRQDGGVLARPEFASMLAAARQETATAGELALMYIDLPVIAAFALDTLAPAAQWAVPGSFSQINIGALPTTETITRHLSGMLMTSQWTASGISTTTTSPAGMLPAIALMVGPAVAFGAYSSRSRMEVVPATPEAEPAEPAPASRPKPKKADDEDGDK